MSGLLSGRRAVVTGGASGIGRAIADALYEAGASVASVDVRHGLRSEETTPSGSATPPGPGRQPRLSLSADVAVPQALESARDEIHERMGPVDLVVANAGVLSGGPFAGSSAQERTAMVEVNITGKMNTAQVFLDDLFLAADAGRPNDLVLIGSAAAQDLLPAFAVYAATAAATAQFARTLRSEVGGRGVRVRHIEPGLTITGLGNDMADDDAKAAVAARRAVNEPLRPRDVAAVVLFTASLPPGTNIAEMTLMPTRHD